MEEMSKTAQIGHAAMKAGMDRKTARRYIAAGKLPSEMRQPRWWRTRPDAFAEDWPAVAKMLEETPGLEAQTVLELLEAKQPGRYNDSHLRTLQRRIQIAPNPGPGTAQNASPAILRPRDTPGDR